MRQGQTEWGEDGIMRQRSAQGGVGGGVGSEGRGGVGGVVGR